jgi:hypothetical protein
MFDITVLSKNTVCVMMVDFPFENDFCIRNCKLVVYPFREIEVLKLEGTARNGPATQRKNVVKLIVFDLFVDLIGRWICFRFFAVLRLEGLTRNGGRCSGTRKTATDFRLFAGMIYLWIFIIISQNLCASFVLFVAK